MLTIAQLLNKDQLSKTELVHLLGADQNGRKQIFSKAAEVKEKYVGNKVYFRGLIEYSNICVKNCFYCGIRGGNTLTRRYEMTMEEIIEAARYAHENKFGSIVIQAGERCNREFVDKITDIVSEIKDLSNGGLGITLSLGEQSIDTYKQWFEAGAHRYLLRIEVSNPVLYGTYHPVDRNHDFKKRIECLAALRNIGYQVGSGVMIGMPFQSLDDLADDLIFLRDSEIDMVGMGPYLEHEHTPMYFHRDSLIPKTERLELSLKMVALLRIMMKDINIAATTAMQAIDPIGREKAIKVGANIIMPNLTPTKYREDYLLYENKPCIDEDAGDCKQCLEARIHIAGGQIGYGEWGDSKRFNKKTGMDD